jgi:hypothetical protein
MDPDIRQQNGRLNNQSIVIWDFTAVSGKVNRFYLNQSATTSRAGV